jgi:hypothetical protein
MKILVLLNPEIESLFVRELKKDLFFVIRPSMNNNLAKFGRSSGDFVQIKENFRKTRNVPFHCC